MSSDLVSYRESVGIATISMDDGKANALSTAMLEQLSRAFDRAEAEAKAIVLTGREGKFCAGFDLREMMAGAESASALVKRGGALLLRLYEIPLPLVVACTGHALAGGALLVAIGDTRVGAVGEFKIGLNEVRNAMTLPIFAHELARDRLVATELVAATLLAKIYDPEAAVSAGWLDQAVAPERVVEVAQAQATELAKLPRLAYAASKRSLRRATIEHVRSTLELNVVELTRSLVAPG